MLRLAETLRSSFALSVLSVAGCADDTPAVLADCMHRLSALCLSGSNMSETAIGRVLQQLRHSSTLRCIDASSCNLDTRSLFALLQLASALPALEQLDLSANRPSTSTGVLFVCPFVL